MVYKYQEDFAQELAASWRDGKREYVRLTIRKLKNKAQIAYIAACVQEMLHGSLCGEYFVSFMHPNNK